MGRFRRCAVAVSLFGIGCGDGPADPGPAVDPLVRDALAAGLAPLPAAPIYPLENPYREERVELGHLLFFDPILSGPKDVACSTCHLPRFGLGDGRQFPAGAGATGLGPDRSGDRVGPFVLDTLNTRPYTRPHLD